MKGRKRTIMLPKSANPPPDYGKRQKPPVQLPQKQRQQQQVKGAKRHD